MGSRIQRALSRAAFAAVGAAAGAAMGGLISRQAASSGGAIGALAGATIAEMRHDPSGFLPSIRSTDEDADEATDAAEETATAD